jgi:hypothetical protein
MIANAAQPRGGSAQLFVRRLDRLDAIPLPGTGCATQPFFSPDGTRIRCRPVEDGRRDRRCCTAHRMSGAGSRGGAWADNDTIVFTGNGVGPLMHVSARGGPPAAASALADGEVTQRWPQFLPSRTKVLFPSNRFANEGYDEANLVVYDTSACVAMSCAKKLRQSRVRRLARPS